jgi:hypothetical protein
MLVTTIAALVLQIHAALAGSGRGVSEWIISGVDLLLIVLALSVFAEAWGILRRRGRKPQIATTGA